MQQRLAIAQAFVMQPRVLLLDEPFGALDPGIRKDMHALLLQLWSETRMTVFMVTHDLAEGFNLGTRLLVFDKVRIDPQAPNAWERALPTISRSMKRGWRSWPPVATPTFTH
jgi:NitT/TauT family transport system ATP-binding protein